MKEQSGVGLQGVFTLPIASKTRLSYLSSWVPQQLGLVFLTSQAGPPAAETRRS